MTAPDNADDMVVKAARMRERRSAEAALSEARAQAEAILAAARDEAEALRARAVAEGEQTGRKAAARIAAEAAAASRAALTRLEPEVVDTLRVCLARVTDWIPPQERLVSLVRRALADLTDQRRLRLSVPVGAGPAAAAALTELAAEIEVIENASLIGDAALLETPNGVIELALETQIAALLDALAAEGA